MEILITIKEKKVKVALMENEVERDVLEIVEEHSLSQQLLPSIDELLKRNQLISKDIEKMRVESDRDESFTTTRIAQAAANAWNYVQQK